VILVLSVAEAEAKDIGLCFKERLNGLFVAHRSLGRASQQSWHDWFVAFIYSWREAPLDVLVRGGSETGLARRWQSMAGTMEVA